MNTARIWPTTRATRIWPTAHVKSSASCRPTIRRASRDLSLTRTPPAASLAPKLPCLVMTSLTLTATCLPRSRNFTSRLLSAPSPAKPNTSSSAATHLVSARPLSPITRQLREKHHSLDRIIPLARRARRPLHRRFHYPETIFSRGPESPGADGWRRFPGSAQAALWTVAELFGSPLSNDPAKSATYQIIGQSCGVVTDLTNTPTTGEVRLRVKPETKARALVMIAACRADNAISPATAAKLRGLLGYVTGLSTSGRAALQPLTAHQYGHSNAISPQLGGSLTFVGKTFRRSLHGLRSPRHRPPPR